MINTAHTPVCRDGEYDILDVEVLVHNLQAGESNVDEVARVLQHSQVHHDKGFAMVLVTLSDYKRRRGIGCEWG